MFKRLLSKGIKNISIDSKKSHILLKNTNFSLVIMRPYDLVQLGDLVGSGSEDILIWTGKTIGKSLCKNIQDNKKIRTRKKLFEALLSYLTNLGYGKFDMEYNKGKNVKIEIKNSIVQEIKEMEDAQLIRNLYNGIFIGSLNSSGVEVEEVSQEFDKKDPIVFEYNFIDFEVVD
ncbi:MAG: hypothetical protein GF364_07760 [Candidatus Lokiarchaeota archaeon]|nr:hypothetical protein [Candidatus Lokiarchaeota archaeon]